MPKQLSILSRVASLLTQFSGKRNLYTTLGYKQTINFDDYRLKYDRQDIAARVVDAFPDATWSKGFEIREDQLPEDTDFERAWKVLNRKLRVIAALRQADIVSGIGAYGILLLGFNDGAPLKEPVKPSSRLGLMYLRSFDEGSATVETLVKDITNPRYGQPEVYEIKFVSDEKTKSEFVHSSRVIHLAENRSSDPVRGVPRMRGVYNRLDDLEKIVGGSGEMFWQGAKGVTQVDVDPERASYESNEDDELDALSDELDEVEHGLRRWLRTRGVTLKQLEAQSPKPKEPFDVVIRCISGRTGIPTRILTGSERGELSSAQDAVQFDNRARGRQTFYADPEIVRPFVDRLISLQVLPQPQTEYSVLWPEQTPLTPKDRATIFFNKMQGLRNYTDTPELVISPDEVRKLLGFLPKNIEGDLLELEQGFEQLLGEGEVIEGEVVF